MYGDIYSTLYTGIFGLLLIGMMLFYPVLLFLGGLMLYYFTGHKPGGNVLSAFMRVGMRLYAHGWMFFAIFLGFSGLYSFLNAIFSMVGGSASSYGYGSSTPGSELALGLILMVVAGVIYFVHWAIAFTIENKFERKGTVLTKLFLGLGLTVSGLVFWGSFISLVTGLVAGSYALGSSLALMLSAAPLWGYFMLRGWLTMRHEPDAKVGKKK